jgi:hypothetical protein
MDATHRARWRGGFAILLALVLLPTCRPTKSARLGEEFSLRVGESAELIGERATVGFRRVLNDSRCPRGVTCVWAGEALTEHWIQGGAAARPEAFQLRLRGGGTSDHSDWVPAAGYRVRLTALEPYPEAGVAADTTARVARLVVQRR